MWVYSCVYKNARYNLKAFRLNAMLSNLNFAAPYATLAVSLPSFFLVYGIYKILAFVYNELTSPIRYVPGPPNPSLIYGSFKQLSESNDSTLLEDWINQYGSTIKFRDVLGSTRLMTSDVKAAHHVLFNSYDYQKPEVIRYLIRKLFGSGIITVEGDVHKLQRKILNPAFGPQQIRELTEIFIEKAIELRDIWSKEVVKQDGAARIDCLSWMSRTTLDIIGLAAFNYKFNALSGDPENNELMKAFSTIFKAGQKLSLIPALRAMYPPLRFLPAPNDDVRSKAGAVMNRIGTKLLEQSKGDKQFHRKDILSVLAQANSMEEKAHQMNDEDVRSQIPTFIVAGHETTSITMSWALYALSQNKDVQTKLREEISNLPTENPTMDDLNGLHYMDAVVRETLRLYPAVASILRQVGKDDCIPLSKPFTDTKGVDHNEVRVRKGQFIMIPITIINRDKSIWGEDADEFKPERWENIPNAVSSVPGVWANVLTFIGGPRACIGFRFSLVETKALLFTLIRAFEIDLAVSPKDLGSRPTNVRRPILLTDPNNSNQMPLIVRPAPSSF